MTFSTKEKQQFLEAEIARLHALLDVGGSYTRHAADEIARLRAALDEVAKGTEQPCAFCFDMANLARKALANEQST